MENNKKRGLKSFSYFTIRRRIFSTEINLHLIKVNYSNDSSLLETPSEVTRHDGSTGEEEQEVSSRRLEDFLSR